MSERVLTQRELNRALLARQLLLQRSTLSIPRALERMGGIQNQYAPNAYVRLWSCLEGFRREQLTHALERRTVVQGTLMRSTIHYVSAREYWRFAVGPQRAVSRVAGPNRQDERSRDAAAERRSSAGARLWTAVARGSSATWRRPAPGLWMEIVRIPPSGTWERRRADYTRSPSSGSGRVQLGRRRPRSSRALVSPRLRAGSARRRLVLGRRPDSHSLPHARAAAPPPLPRRGRVASSSIYPVHRCHLPTRRRRSASCPGGTRCCSSTPGARASCRRNTGRSSSRRRTRRPCPPSSSTAALRAPGATTMGGSSSSRTSGCRARCSGSSARKGVGLAALMSDGG